MKAEHMKRNRLWGMAAVAVILFVALAAMPVAADGIYPYPQNNKTYIPVANPPAQYPTSGLGTAYYYFNLTNASADAGAKAIHIASNNYTFAGDKTTIPNTSSYSFYVSDTGGKGCQDDIILLVSVNKSRDPFDNFRIKLNVSGYQWDANLDESDGTLPSWSSFSSGATWSSWEETFEYSDFAVNSTQDVFQEWKFANAADYPTYNSQIIGGNDTLFKILPVDLKVGVIGNNSKKYGTTYYANLTDFGMVNVSYSLYNVTSDDTVAFNVYAYNNQTSQGKGINWFNKVLPSGTSGSGASGWVMHGSE
ncbi:hypothetical protein [Methanoregula sp.]|uniref:hypothetical protein n=1 Tax=Methanoregula sp. TaxID=2052170 RepID=UPI0035679E1A